MIKKCPVCNSSRFRKKGGAMACERCGYVWRGRSTGFRPAGELA